MYSNRSYRQFILVAMQLSFFTVGSLAFADDGPFDAEKQARLASSGSLQVGGKAVDALREHATRQDAHAQYQLGRCYEEGWSVSKNLQSAAEWYGAAAASGIAPASLRLGALYLRRGATNRNTELSLQLLQQAAKSGSAEAEYFVGWCYEYGVLDKRAAAGVDEHSVLLTCLQQMMVAPSPGNMEFAQSAWSIGFQPVTPLPDSAVSAYKQSADHGYAPASLWFIGTYLATGQGDETRIQKCIHILSKQDDPLMLGYYEMGKGWLQVTKWRSLVMDDSARSISKLKELADKGDPDAMDCLAVIGLGNKVNEFSASRAAAEKWRQNAVLARRQKAESGDIVSQFKIAKAYEEGKYIARDMRAAARWYNIAAEAGYPWAQVEIAKCYDNGIGMDKNPKIGEVWRKLATRQGVQ